MKKQLCFLVTIALILTAAFTLPFAASAETAETEKAAVSDASKVLGVTHAGGYYTFDPSVSYVEEGAQILENMGTKVIKLWLTSTTMTSNYLYNTQWGDFSIKTPIDILNTPYYKSIMAMDFDTYIFEYHDFDLSEGAVAVDWLSGMTDAEVKAVEDQMYELAKYLMIEFSGTGKNFVLQNWEGDNMVRTNFMTGNTAEDKVKIAGFRDWINARQRGLDKARGQYGSLNVSVEHAMEVNFVPVVGDSYIQSSWPILIKSVVPYTDCDLYSYSCWSAKTFPDANTLTARLQKYDDSIGETYIDVTDGNKVKPRREANGSRLMLGEYGSQESLGTVGGSLATKYNDSTDKFQRIINQIQTEQALDYGVRYIMYWELFCNELKSGISLDVANGETNMINENNSGFYLIRPDGSYVSTYYYLQGLMTPEEVFLVNSDQQKSEYTFDAPASIFEIGVTAAYNAGSEFNNKNRSVYADFVTISAAGADGIYLALETENFVTVQGDGTAHLRYVNKAPLDAKLRKLKVTLESGKTLEYVKVYKTGGDRQFKMVVEGSQQVGGEEVTSTVSKYTLGSGDLLMLSPRMTKDGFDGEYSFKTSNRYIASIEVKNGGVEVLGRTNGTAVITVTATGGGLAKPYVMPIEVNVKVLGELLIEDDFSGYENTAAYGDNGDGTKNETKLEKDKVPNFGENSVKPGAEQKYYRTNNIQFNYLDVEKVPSKNYLKVGTGGDPYFAYILDWENFNSASITYETVEDIGGYDVGLINFGGGGALDRLSVYVSADNESFTKINGYVTSSKGIGNDWNNVRVSNKQIIPAGMTYIKFEIKYVDVNRWNPQLFSIGVYGEAGINPEYVDTVKPTISVNGSYKTDYVLGEKINLHSATFSDNFATTEELEYTRRVYAVIDGAEIEQPLEGDSFVPGIIGRYKIEYKVVDLGGLESTKTFFFNVDNKTDKGCAACSTIGFSGTGGIAVILGLLAMGAIVLFIKKPSKKKV